MKITNSLLLQGGLLALCAQLGAAAPCPGPQALHIQAWIDGRSRLVLDADTATWEHLDFAAPGRLDCNTGEPMQPTLIDGLVWYPDWPDVPDCENRDCACGSSQLAGLPQPVPELEVFPELVLIQARGAVTLVEQPVASNGYRIVVEFDDNSWGGADWYEIEVLFAECGVQGYCPSLPNSTGAAALLTASGSLSVGGFDTVLAATHCPPAVLGLFIYGQNKFELPFANGMLCVNPLPPGLFRLQPAVLVSPLGEGKAWLDFAALPSEGQILAGTTWSFQFWFRDAAAGAASANLTNGLRMTFCP